jgi:hypothetical protein
MLGGTVRDRVSSINNLRVIMEEKMTFPEHMDVMTSMLGFTRRLSLEFRDPYNSGLSLHVSGLFKTGIRKLRVEPVL